MMFLHIKSNQNELEDFLQRSDYQPIENKMKNIIASKTVWLNIITLVLAILALPEFISVLPVSILPFIVLLSGVLNLVLRIYFTKTEIK